LEVILSGDRHQLTTGQARGGEWTMLDAVLQQHRVLLGFAFIMNFNVDLVAGSAGQQTALETEQLQADAGTAADGYLAQLDIGLVNGIASGRFDLSTGVKGGGPNHSQGYGNSECELFHGSILCYGWVDVLSADGWKAAALYQARLRRLQRVIQRDGRVRTWQQITKRHRRC